MYYSNSNPFPCEARAFRTSGAKFLAILPFLHFLRFPVYSLSLLQHSPLLQFTMAPITEEAVSGLKNTIQQLEAKVSELESRLANGGKPKSAAEQMRIILMGPPGAGMQLKHNWSGKTKRQWILTVSIRQGYSGPEP